MNNDKASQITTSFAPGAPLLVYESVPGAPLEVGAEVIIVNPERALERFIGTRGVIIALFYDEPLLRMPHQPLIVVRVKGLGEAHFFARELRCTAQRAA